jgi:uncharacterized protein with PQ loop repeat
MRHLHFHIRRRREPYPARKSSLRWLDRFVLLVGVLGPIMTLPQIWLIFSTKDAGGVSALAFGTWALFDIPWMLYGIAHREPPIVATYTLWLVGNGLVCLGAILYS